MIDLIYLAKGIKIVGLSISIFGSALLYKYSMPVVINGGTWDNSHKEEKIEQYHPKYKKGFRILLIGFSLQFIGEILS